MRKRPRSSPSGDATTSNKDKKKITTSNNRDKKKITYTDDELGMINLLFAEGMDVLPWGHHFDTLEYDAKRKIWIRVLASSQDKVIHGTQIFRFDVTTEDDENGEDDDEEEDEDEFGNKPDGTIHLMTADKIQKAWKIFSFKKEYSSEYNMLKGDDEDYGDLDECTADSFIQLCLFGKILYA